MAAGIASGRLDPDSIFMQYEDDHLRNLFHSTTYTHRFKPEVAKWLAYAQAQPSAARAMEILAGSHDRIDQAGFGFPSARTVRKQFSVGSAAPHRGSDKMGYVIGENVQAFCAFQRMVRRCEWLAATHAATLAATVALEAEAEQAAEEEATRADVDATMDLLVSTLERGEEAVAKLMKEKSAMVEAGRRAMLEQELAAAVAMEVVAVEAVPTTAPTALAGAVGGTALPAAVTTAFFLRQTLRARVGKRIQLTAATSPHRSIHPRRCRKWRRRRRRRPCRHY